MGEQTGMPVTPRPAHRLNDQRRAEYQKTGARPERENDNVSRPQSSAAAVAVAAFAASGVLGLLLLAFQQTLPHAPPGQQLAIAAYRHVQAVRLLASVEQIGNAAPARAVCRPIAGAAQPTLLVTFSDGRRLRVGTTSTTVMAGQHETGVRRWAESELAGCTSLLGAQLANAIIADRPVYAGTTRLGRRIVERFLLGVAPKQVELLTTPALTPIAVRLRCCQFRGTGTLVPEPRSGHRQATQLNARHS